jgi:hypothetical protein
MAFSNFPVDSGLRKGRGRQLKWKLEAGLLGGG